MYGVVNTEGQNSMSTSSRWTRNRLKFLLAGPLLEAGNRFMLGRPHQRLAQEVAAERPRRVLELCGGTGYASRLVAELRPNTRIDSIDISPEMLAVGRSQLRRSGVGNVTLHRGDAAILPFPDNTFDVVMSVFGWHELPTDTRREAVKESVRVLRPGGAIIAIDHDAPPKLGRAYRAYIGLIERAHAREVLGSGLADLFVDHRLVVTNHHPASSWSVPVQIDRAELRDPRMK